MDAGPRLLALIVDLALALGSGQLLGMGVGAALGGGEESATLLVSASMMVGVNFLWPLLFLAIPTGIWGRTPGKLLCRLGVEGETGGPPGIPRALLREGLKLLSLSLMIVPIICLYQLMHSGTVWYDHACRTSVRFRPWVKLSATQKNFRKVMREFDSGR